MEGGRRRMPMYAQRTVKGIVVCLFCFLFWQKGQIEIAMFRLEQWYHTKYNHNAQQDGRNASNWGEVWPSMQEVLCPNRTPRVDLGMLLMQIANEVFFKHVFYNNKRVNATKMFQQFQKSGDPLNEFWMGSYHGYRALSLPSPLPPIFYMRIWKGGNDQITHWFEQIEKERGISVEKYMNGSSALPVLNSQQPCLLTAVRDPISHFLSGYNEYDFRCQKADKRPCQGRYQKIQGRNQTRKRFLAFMRDFLSGDTQLWGTGPTEETSNVQLMHVYPMSRVLAELASVSPDLPAKLSILPTLDQLTTTWPPFMDDAYLKHLHGLDHENDILSLEQQYRDLNLSRVTMTRKYHDSSSDPYGNYQAAKDVVWKEQGSTAWSLCVLHLLDYACFHDLPDGVPLLCQRVYTRPDFLERITKELER